LANTGMSTFWKFIVIIFGGWIVFDSTAVPFRRLIARNKPTVDAMRLMKNTLRIEIANKLSDAAAILTLVDQRQFPRARVDATIRTSLLSRLEIFFHHLWAQLVPHLNLLGGLRFFFMYCSNRSAGPASYWSVSRCRRKIAR